MEGMTPGEKILASLFQSVTPRTAGFNTVDLTALRDVYKRQMLDREEQAILHARFWQDKSQRSIAEELGVSQMYVSRKEKKILAKMRETIRKSGAV